jgi:hypothetical protein
MILASAKGGFMRASRQLRRRGISESRLPQGSIVRYQDPSLWALYRGYVAGGVLILGVMSLTWDSDTGRPRSRCHSHPGHGRRARGHSA